MFELLMLAGCLWLIVMVLVVVYFMVKDFDRSKRDEWFGAGMIVPALAVALALSIDRIGAFVGQSLLPGAAWLRLAAFGG